MENYYGFKEENMNKKIVIAICVIALIVTTCACLVACNPEQATGTYSCGNQKIEISNVTKDYGYAKFTNVETLNGTYTSSSSLKFDIYANNNKIYSVKITINGKTYDEKFDAKNGTFTFNGNKFTKE